MPTSNLRFNSIIFQQDPSLIASLQSSTTNKRENTVKEIITANNNVSSNIPYAACGGATSSTVDNTYPRSILWGGKSPVLVPVLNSPSYRVNLNNQSEVNYQKTKATPQEYIKSAEELINTLNPNANTAYKKEILIAALSISISEQGLSGFNYNLSGVESSGFSVFNAGDIAGKVQAIEGGTGKRKYYYAFTSLKAGLIPLISTIMKRNMFAIGGTSGEFAWRWYRDWNGYGARAKGTTDCQNIESVTTSYNDAKAKVNLYSTFR